MPLIRDYGLPATAICPGCGTMVVLPAEPIFPDSPPAICATCDTEVPDYRRQSYDPSTASAFQPAPQTSHLVRPTPQPVSEPIENKRLSRAALFRSLGGVLAERGAEVIENAKGNFGG
jgi:hypothetical protein